ncbi:hypothetical protein MMC21_007435 [Puttea exsequens]|nr:hypothetical protein [Puttea exsequens]
MENAELCCKPSVKYIDLDSHKDEVEQQPPAGQQSEKRYMSTREQTWSQDIPKIRRSRTSSEQARNKINDTYQAEALVNPEFLRATQDPDESALKAAQPGLARRITAKVSTEYGFLSDVLPSSE